MGVCVCVCVCVCACMNTWERTPTGQPSSMKASLIALPTGTALYTLQGIFLSFLSILAAILLSKYSCFHFTEEES